MRDVLVIGGGVIGCAVALAAARRGLSVTLIDRGPLGSIGHPGPEGSGAAAGIVGAQLEGLHGDGPLSRLCLASRDRYPRWIEGLAELTGLDVELRSAGVSCVALDAAHLARLKREVQWQRDVGLSVEILDGAGARAIEPALTAEVLGGVRFPEDPRIDPPALVAALRVAVERAGVVVRPGCAVRRVLVRSGRAAGVGLDDGTAIESAAVVVAAGSWSSLIDDTALAEDAVQPARGQMLELHVDSPLIQGVIEGPECYLSPRDDGRILLGSTVELVGFRPGATVVAAHRLLGAAIRLVPAIEGATLRRAWAGLRPHTRDELPLIGKPGIEGLVIATGHFRNGVLLAPITGEIVAALLTGGESPVDLAPFSPTRALSA